MTKKKPDIRACAQCAGPIPYEKPMGTMYCSPNCGRVASYQRLSLEERREVNRRSNRRRTERDLLPRVRSLAEVSKGITPGSPLAQYVALCTLVAAQSDWKLAHALNFNAAQDALHRLTGDPQVLERFEDLVAA